MLSENKLGGTDAFAFSKSRIQVGVKPDWVEECSYDMEFKGENERHTTNLLLDRQIHAERSEDYVHEAVRLETMEAVQHLSQWRLQFEPQAQSITFHFIRVKRGKEIFEQLNFERGHLFQREEGLNRFVIDGWFTYLQVLEDVRPGDVLEWAYTIRTTGKILSEYCVHFQNLPEWTSIGKYQFVVRYKTGREMKWKTSSKELTPLWSNADGLSIWTWYADKYTGLKREPNTPSWYVSAPWIQVSDCPDWRTVANAIADAWAKQEIATNALDELVNEIEKEKADLEERLDKAIQLIQDEHRYLSINLEFGGQTPTSPDVVARRRYGDCKDLTFLLVNLLRRLGVQARPVLVNAQLRKTIGEVLPALGVFNHAIVEFEAEGKRRWIDPTIMRQGGGAFNRVVPDFCLGLPIDKSATGLIESPIISGQSNLYELHETIQLDTSGAKSLVALNFRAEGIQADKLRNEFESNGVQGMAKLNLQGCANRFGWANRIGELKYRDDRVANRFFMAEVFEIDRFLQAHPDRRVCRFPIPSHWIKNTLQMPEKKDRRTPFALPYPCHLVHIIDVEFAAIKPDSTRNIEPRCSLENSYVHFNRTKKTGYGYWVMNLSVSITSDSVPPDQIEKHREFVERIWAASLWNLLPPLGYSKPRQKRDFGELPPPMIATTTSVKSLVNTVKPDHQNGSSANRVAEQPIPFQEPVKNVSQQVNTIRQTEPRPVSTIQKKKRHHGKAAILNRYQIVIIVVAGAILLLFVLFLVIVSSGDRAPH
ncbi:MAG TPA: DUF3857 domain-containing transglutaminase family protein [Verrucomicrobiae bacterium]|jgi:hypothetical protein